MQEVPDNLKEYLEYLRKVSRHEITNAPEIFLQKDDSLWEKVQTVKGQIQTNALSHIFLIGTGGSNLGTKAIYDASLGHLDPFTPNRFPKMHFLETYDETLTSTAVDFLKENLTVPEKVLFILVTKSGTTAESLSIRDYLRSHLPCFDNRLVIITGEGSPLTRNTSTPLLTIPPALSGRYSVFSAVGVFPIALVDEEMAQKMLSIEMDDCFLSDVVEENPNLQFALSFYNAYQSNLDIHDTFIFEPSFQQFGLWYRQLFAESLGKNGMSFTPTVTMGTVDLHSQLQLYLGGKNRRFTTFLAPIKSTGALGEAMQKTFDYIINTFRDHDLPFLLHKMDSRADLPQLMLQKMIEVALLAKLLNVNAFDQPEVEKFKNDLRQS